MYGRDVARGPAKGFDQSNEMGLLLTQFQLLHVLHERLLMNLCGVLAIPLQQKGVPNNIPSPHTSHHEARKCSASRA